MRSTHSSAVVFEVLTSHLPETLTARDVECGLHDLMDANYQAIRETGPAVAGSLLDAYNVLNGYTGAESIESDQVANSSSGGWEATVKTGVLWHATYTAIRAHYDQSQIGVVHHQDQ